MPDGLVEEGRIVCEASRIAAVGKRVRRPRRRESRSPAGNQPENGCGGAIDRAILAIENDVFWKLGWSPESVLNQAIASGARP
jgi:hypothetical protein